MPTTSNSPRKVAIVTGASSGIGKAVAIDFLQLGYDVYAAARRVDSMKDLEAKGAHLQYLDLTQPDSVKTCVATVLAQSGRVDVLVNNAGYGFLGAVEDVPMEDARQQVEVNLFGVAQMIQEILPTMRRQRSGKIINVTSIGGKIWTPLGAWYHASKFAVEGFSDALRNEVRQFGIDVVIVEPGATKTEWATIAADNLRKVSSNGAYKQMADAAATLYGTVGGDSPESVAAGIVKAATVRRPKARYVTGAASKAILSLRWLLPDRTFDGVLLRAFRIPRTL